MKISLPIFVAVPSDHSYKKCNVMQKMCYNVVYNVVINHNLILVVIIVVIITNKLLGPKNIWYELA